MYKRRRRCARSGPVLLLAILCLLIFMTCTQIIFLHNSRYNDAVRQRQNASLHQRVQEYELRELGLDLAAIMRQDVATLDLNRRLLQSHVNRHRFLEILQEASQISAEDKGHRSQSGEDEIEDKQSAISNHNNLTASDSAAVDGVFDSNHHSMEYRSQSSDIFHHRAEGLNHAEGSTSTSNNKRNAASNLGTSNQNVELIVRHGASIDNSDYAKSNISSHNNNSNRTAIRKYIFCPAVPPGLCKSPIGSEICLYNILKTLPISLIIS